MPRFCKNSAVFVAHQWFENGDHPEDECVPVFDDPEFPTLTEGKIVRRFRRPEMDELICPSCGGVMEDHGWIDTHDGGYIVCPGNFIVTDAKGDYRPMGENVLFETCLEVLD